MSAPRAGLAGRHRPCKADGPRQAKNSPQGLFFARARPTRGGMSKVAEPHLLMRPCAGRLALGHLHRLVDAGLHESDADATLRAVRPTMVAGPLCKLAQGPACAGREQRRLPQDGPPIIRRMDEVFGLFPTPFLRAPATLDARLVKDLVQYFSAMAVDRNKASDNLSHTTMLRPADSALLVEAAALIAPKLVDMGALIFGQRLGWSIKEMWVNVLDTGGMQAPHTHANSFVSGVVYLTEMHPGAQTVFMKASGGTEFLFKNESADVTPTAFNAERWVSPTPAPGDMVLFPSYLTHAVPPNPGKRRITLAFNAIPGSLDSWGYKIKFSG